VIANANRRKTPGDGMAIGRVEVANEMVRCLTQGKVAVIWRAIHSAVGLAVALRDISRRRWCLRTTNTNSNLKPTVGTTGKSIAPPAAWLRKKVFQVCDRPRPLFTMYSATDDCTT